MSSLDRLSKLPNWPGRMTAPVAALYMGVSTTTFLTRFRSIGVKEGANVFWARAQLDLYIAEQFDLHVGTPFPCEWDKYLDEAPPPTPAKSAKPRRRR